MLDLPPVRDLPPSLRAILIGGSSHSGKSTLARLLAARLGWEYRSTDQLARHPGRPWRNDGTDVPPHVVEHYSSLSVDDLVADVLGHYQRNVLPQIVALVGARTSDPSARGLVLEGSAIWPEHVACLVSDKTAALWLTAGEELLAERIRTESRYCERAPQEQMLIAKFIQRTVAFATRMDEAVGRNGLPGIRTSRHDTAQMLERRCLEAIASRPR